LAELETISDELWRADRAADDSDPLKNCGLRRERNALPSSRWPDAAAPPETATTNPTTTPPRTGPDPDPDDRSSSLTDVEALAGN
jgi:hypothetical protein